MRSSVYVYVLLALTSSLTLAAPISTSERRFVIPPDVVGPISFPPPLPPIIKNPFEGMGPGPVIPPPGTVKRAEEGREFPFDQFDFSPLDNFIKDHPDLVAGRGVGSTKPASERRFVLPPGTENPFPPFPPPLPPIIKDPLEGMGPGPVIPPPGTVERAEERREFPFDQFDFSPLDNFLKDHPDLVAGRGVGSTQPASERRFVLPPGTVNPFPPFPPPLPPIIKDPLEGMGPGPVIPPPGTVKRAEERREFSHVAGQSNEDVPVPPDFGAFRVKRADGALLPVPGQAGHSFFPLPPDDLPIALPTPIFDRDAQADFSDFLNKFFEARPNQIFDRGVDYRRLYVDALRDLLRRAGESS